MFDRPDPPRISYSPLSRYDELISSHATACEHQTEYFIYYHRNLMLKYVIALQEADFILRKKDTTFYDLTRNNMNESELQAFDRALN